MVIDFSIVKRIVGSWIDSHWDHNLLIWEGDDPELVEICQRIHSVSNLPLPYLMPVMPTAENIAADLFVRAETLLESAAAGLQVIGVRVWETPNYSAIAVHG